jgi:para-aminobenzoate synthetase component 1
LKDEALKKELKNNPKEIAENVMIVDLVRNDLSRFPRIKSVKTIELCKLYSFDTVHQLISTIKAELKHNVSLYKVTKNLFPMGSMTGAPKISACQIIDEVENFKRGIYSGTVGFISPNNNHDFNVVIRSILFNSNNKTVSVSVGGAITIQSIPEAEFDECLLKLKAINQSIVGMSNK